MRILASVTRIYRKLNSSDFLKAVLTVPPMCTRIFSIFLPPVVDVRSVCLNPIIRLWFIFNFNRWRCVNRTCRVVTPPAGVRMRNIIENHKTLFAHRRTRENNTQRRSCRTIDRINKRVREMGSVDYAMIIFFIYTYTRDERYTLYFIRPSIDDMVFPRFSLLFLKLIN